MTKTLLTPTQLYDLNVEMLKAIQTNKAKCIPKQISEKIAKKLEKTLNIDTNKV